LTLVLFCGMCFTADFVIVSLKDIPHIGYLAVIVLEHIWQGVFDVLQVYLHSIPVSFVVLRDGPWFLL
jgi:hypothetical protein